MKGRQFFSVDEQRVMFKIMIIKRNSSEHLKRNQSKKKVLPMINSTELLLFQYEKKKHYISEEISFRQHSSSSRMTSSGDVAFNSLADDTEKDSGGFVDGVGGVDEIVVD